MRPEKKDDAYKKRRKHRAFTRSKKTPRAPNGTKHMNKYLFHNFTNKAFTGYWNGKAYTFKPGVKKYYIKGIAEHFAKHLTNQILTESNQETFCSPKKPNEVPVFMEIFNKALLVEVIPDEDNLDVPGGEIESDVPSMEIKVSPRVPIDPYDSHSQPSVGPGSAPQVVGEAIDEDDDFVPDKK